MQHKATILTGAIQTGKSTSLIKWCEGKENIQGILTPIADGKRMFMDISTKGLFAMEAHESETDVLRVGHFVFSAAAFQKAKQIIIGSTNCNYLIIDEVGPLELRQEGLFAAIQQVLQNQKNNIILVVREGLVDKVIQFFSLVDVSTIIKTQLDDLI